jgi:hypothetical protein
MMVGERGARLGPKGDELALVLPSRKAEVVHGRPWALAARPERVRDRRQRWLLVAGAKQAPRPRVWRIH